MTPQQFMARVTRQADEQIARGDTEVATSLTLLMLLGLTYCMHFPTPGCDISDVTWLPTVPPEITGNIRGYSAPRSPETS